MEVFLEGGWDCFERVVGGVWRMWLYVFLDGGWSFLYWLAVFLECGWRCF